MTSTTWKILIPALNEYPLKDMKHWAKKAYAHARRQVNWKKAKKIKETMPTRLPVPKIGTQTGLPESRRCRDGGQTDGNVFGYSSINIILYFYLTRLKFMICNEYYEYY